MSTNNYNYDNILIAIDCTDWDEWETDELRERVGEHLQTVIGGYTLNEWEPGRQGGRIFWYISIVNKSGYEYKRIKAVLRSGYYSGLNLDYTIEDGGDLYWYDDRSTKMVDLQVARMTRKVAKILRGYGTELVKVAQYSNGEAVYKKK